LLQVVAATALLTVFLMWGAAAFNWTALRAHPLERAGLMAGMLAVSAVIYFAALWAAGVKVRHFLTH
jgi:putative peptidoglycan lipid II flippase